MRDTRARTGDHPRARPVTHNGVVRPLACLPTRPPTRLARSVTALGLGSALALSATLTTVTLAAPASAADVNELVTKRLANPRLGSDVAMLVVDVASGETVFDSSGDERQLPASTMKILTAVASLATLGADHRFATRVRQAPSSPEGLSVVLEGGGDPLLSRDDLRALADTTAKALRQQHRDAGGTGKPGAVVHADTRLFPDTGKAVGWTSSYIPSVAASVESLALLGEYSRDPSSTATKAFAGYLRDAGVRATIGETVSSGAIAGAQVADLPKLAEVTSHTTADAVRRMLSISDNNVAEVLHRHVAVAKGLPADWQGSQAATEQVLADLGINLAGSKVRDGSGLSRKDRVSPRVLVDVLRMARTDEEKRFAVMFEDDALPVAGQTGTLAKAYGRYSTKPSRCATGAARAKTGSLFDVIALSGLATTTAGREQAFAILVNDRPQAYSALATRQAVDGLVATINGCWD